MDNKQPISVGLYYQKVYVHYKDGTDETIEFDNIKDAFEKYSDISSQIPPQIIEQQYNAVVAQNKSLQGELLLSKKMIELIIIDLKTFAILLNSPKHPTDTECLDFYKKQALQELEAEND